MNPGKHIRMGRLLRGGRAVVVAADHGGIAGPLPGIVAPAALMRACVRGGADAVLTTRGFIRAALAECAPATSLLLRLSGGFTVLGGLFEDELISSPETALRYGASGAAVTVKFGHAREGDFIRQASLLADACELWGLPLLVEALAKDGKLADAQVVALAARAAQEIGADLVKCRYTGDPDSFRAVVEGCPAPVLILGGEKAEGLGEVFEQVHGALQAGGAGVAIGRNVFQHPQPQAVVEALVGLVHQGCSVKQALANL